MIGPIIKPEANRNKIAGSLTRQANHWLANEIRPIKAKARIPVSNTWCLPQYDCKHCSHARDAREVIMPN